METIKTLSIVLTLSLLALSSPAAITPEDIKAKVKQMYGEDCNGDEILGDENIPLSQSLQTGASGEQLTLWEAFCYGGANNVTSVYFLVNAQDKVTPLSFAEPVVSVSYVDGDTKGAIKYLKILGVSSTPFLVNPSFDPLTRTLSSHNRWRAPGDASASGHWSFNGESFSLIHYEVDASYDGKANPVTVMAYEN